MVARGDYIFNQQRPQINMVDGSDVGRYMIKIMPNMPLSTLQLEVKTYYCNKVGTPRTRFFSMDCISESLLEIGDIQYDTGGVEW
jgi:hypothetical protein